MRPNFLERLFIISPLRILLHDHLETRQLLEMGGPARGARALEVDCRPGSGLGLTRPSSPHPSRRTGFEVRSNRQLADLYI
jgi:hypothetical protein